MFTGTQGPITNPSVHQLIEGVVGLATTIGGLTTAIGPTTGPVTKVTMGAVGDANSPLGPKTNGLGGTVPKDKRTDIVLS